MLKVTKIQLVTILGTFTFADKHDEGVDFYAALRNFETNNWKMLGEFHYLVTELYKDGKEIVTKLDGMNADTELAAYFDEEAADALDAYYASQHH